MKINPNHNNQSQDDKFKTPMSPRDEKHKKSNQSDDNYRPLWKRFWPLELLIIIGLIGMFMVGHHKSNSQQASSNKSSVTYQKLKPLPKTNENKFSNQKGKNKDTIDMKKPITEFFTAYQQYQTKNDDVLKARQKNMSKYAEPTVVKTLINSNANNSMSQIEAEFKLNNEPQIQEMQPGVYNVILNYRVMVGKNHTDHKDTYSVDTSKNKITNVSQLKAQIE